MRLRAPTIVVAAAAFGAAAVVLPVAPVAAKPAPFNLKALKNSIARNKNVTYLATYAGVAGGKSSTITVAQAPPKSVFATTSGSVISTGTNTYYCAAVSGSGPTGGTGAGAGNGGSQPTCISTKLSNPLIGIVDAFNPQVVLRALGTTIGGIVARVLGIKVVYSSAVFAGQPSSCVAVTRKSQSVKYCVTKQGILSYSGTSPQDYFELTKYSSKPPGSLFALPSGATVVTVPGAPGSPG